MRITLEPTINVSSKEELLRHLRLVKHAVDVVQVDVSDGIFARPKTFSDLSIIRGEVAERTLHVHLMVSNVPSYIEEWSTIRPKRISFHIEAEPMPERLFSSFSSRVIERGLALGPSTSLDAVLPFLRSIDFLLFVSVPPGRSGQRFDPMTLARVRAVHSLCPELPIGVDGGILPNLVRPLIEAGATTICVGSGIFHAQNPQQALTQYLDCLTSPIRSP